MFHNAAELMIDENITSIELNKKESALFPYYLFQAVESGDKRLVKALCILGGIDPNYTIRMDPVKRTKSDKVPLRIAIELYNLDMAQLLIDLGALPQEVEVEIDTSDIYYDIEKVKDFCKSHGIKYREVNNG